MAGSDPVQSVVRALDIVDRVAQSPEGVSLMVLARMLDVSPSTAHNLVRTLVLKRYLEKAGEPPRYRLGRAIVGLFEQRQHHWLLEQAAEQLANLRKQFSAAVATLSQALGGEIVTLLRMSPERPGLVQQPMGMRQAAYTSASSLVYLAFWDDEQRQSYMRQFAFEDFGAPTWRSIDQLEDFLADVRRVGYSARGAGEGLARVAAPVWGRGGQLEAVVGLAMQDAASSQHERMIAAVVSAAGSLSSGEDDKGEA